MLVFFDETFRTLETKGQSMPFGALCGIAIEETKLSKIARDVFQIKRNHLGDDFARDKEIKGTQLLKNYAFKLRDRGIESKNLALAEDLAKYIRAKRLPIFGTVCFHDHLQKFSCTDMTALDKTFRFIFERVDMFMRIEHPDQMAALVFDDRDQGTNERNATAITNFFLRSPDGLALDRVLDTPFFGISQSQNVGLQLADFITTIIGMRFEKHINGKEFFQIIKPAIYRWEDPPGQLRSGLKVLRKPSPGS